MKKLSSQLLVEYTIFQILEEKALKKRQSTPENGENGDKSLK